MINMAFGFLNQAVSLGVNHLKRVVSNAILPGEKRENTSEGDLYAHLSKHAYNMNNDEVDKEILKHGYKVDRELSNKNAKVYSNTKTGDAVIGYRGTDPSNIEDLAADLHIASGSRSHKRFREAEDLAKSTMNKYKGKKVRVTGHSLGGTQALHVNDKLGLEASVYNPGASAVGNEKPIKNKNVKVTRHAGDLVSGGLKAGNEKRVTLHGNRSSLGLYDVLKNHSIF